VEVVAHQAVRKDDPFVDPPAALEQPKEQQPVPAVEEDVLSVDAAHRHMRQATRHDDP
jgi:hypothetical protein